MIILNLQKCNTNFKKILNIYSNLSNYGPIRCPFCHSSQLIRWGFYQRNVIYFDPIPILTSHLLTVQRMKCKSCCKTHALLPLGIIPYKQFSSQIITTLLLESTTHTPSFLSHHYLIDFNIIRIWIHHFRKHHLSRLRSLLHCSNLSFLLHTIHTNIDTQQQYLLFHSICFMQYKRSIIGLCPS